MSFDEIFDLTAGVYFFFFNIYIGVLLRKVLHFSKVQGEYRASRTNMYALT